MRLEWSRDHGSHQYVVLPYFHVQSNVFSGRRRNRIQTTGHIRSQWRVLACLVGLQYGLDAWIVHWTSTIWSIGRTGWLLRNVLCSRYVLSSSLYLIITDIASGHMLGFIAQRLYESGRDLGSGSWSRRTRTTDLGVNISKLKKKVHFNGFNCPADLSTNHI